jgi:hypothetical protein
MAPVAFRSLAVAACLVACARPGAHHEGAMKMKVPAGAWQRDWIQRRGGALDRRITVRYVQTPSVFGDVRIPADRTVPPDAASFADLTDDQLAVLATQNGFAGVTTVDGDHATWHHEIDYQPAGGGADIGRIEPAGDGKMFEHGLDGSYVESWSALEPDAGAYFAARLARDGRVDQLLAVAGGHFVYARARRAVLPPADSISEAIARTHATRELIIAYLDCEISYGTVHGWKIEHSTLPWQHGKRLVFADRIVVDAEGKPALRAAAPAEGVWSFPVNTFPAAELRALFPAP